MTSRYVHYGYLVGLLLKKTPKVLISPKLSPSSQMLTNLMLWEEQSVMFKCRNSNLRKEKQSSIEISRYHECINILWTICSLAKAVWIILNMNCPPQSNLSGSLGLSHDPHRPQCGAAVILRKDADKTSALPRGRKQRLNRQLCCKCLSVSTGCCRSSHWGDSTRIGGVKKGFLEGMVFKLRPKYSLTESLNEENLENPEFKCFSIQMGASLK